MSMISNSKNNPEVISEVDLRIERVEAEAGSSLLRLLYLTDGRCAGPFHAYTLLNCEIRVGSHWSEETELWVQSAEQERSAREYALVYVAQSAHSAFEVVRYLTKKRSVAKDVAERVVARLMEDGYLNDRALCERIVEQVLVSRARESRQALTYRLRRKGIAVSIVAEVLEEHTFPEYEGALDAATRKLPEIDRKLSRATIRTGEQYPDEEQMENDEALFGQPRQTKTAKTVSPQMLATKRKAALASYLARKGYGSDTIVAVLESLLAE